MASGSSITSPYLAWMSKRLARCGPSARSPTQSAGTSTSKPDCTASTTLARTHPLVVAPQISTCPPATRSAARPAGAEERRSALLLDHMVGTGDG